MRIDLTARHTEIGPSFRQHAEPRLQKLRRYFGRIQEVQVSLSKQRNWHTVEITINANGMLVRSEERAGDDISAFDSALEKVSRQLVRLKSRLRKRGHHVGKRELPAEELELEEPEDLEEEETPGAEIKIVKTKSFPIKPMSPEEAALQMELLGHDFFMFTNGETQQVNLVYRRKDGAYGLLTPEPE